MSEPFGHDFLHFPDLFPGRASGDRWGSGQVFLRVAGGPYLISGLDEGMLDAVSGRFGEYAADSAAARISVDVSIFRAASSDFRPIDLIGGDYRFDTDYQISCVRIAGQRFMARLDNRGPVTSAAIWLADSAELVAAGILENCLRVLVAYRLLELGGVLLHSSGVVGEGGGWIFPGQSGSGKTTVSRASLAVGLPVLSDDMNALVPSDLGWEVEKLPFAGDLGPTETVSDRYPVRALCRLRKGAVNRVDPLGKGEALALLVASASYVNADPHQVDRLLETLGTLVEQIPVLALTFNREEPFWPALRQAARRSSGTDRVDAGGVHD